jgi:hypothetical protein
VLGFLESRQGRPQRSPAARNQMVLIQTARLMLAPAAPTNPRKAFSQNYSNDSSQPEELIFYS